MSPQHNSNIILPFEGDLAIAHAGGVVPLLVLLRNGTDRQKAGAARALRHLAKDRDSRMEIAKNQGIETLLELLEGTDVQKEAASQTLQQIYSFADGKDAISHANATNRDILFRDVSAARVGRMNKDHPGRLHLRDLVIDQIQRWTDSDPQEKQAICEQIYDHLRGEFRRFLWVRRREEATRNECLEHIQRIFGWERYRQDLQLWRTEARNVAQHEPESHPEDAKSDS